MTQYSRYPITPISINAFSPEALSVANALVVQGATGVGNQAWRAAKRVVYIPFELEDPYYAARIQWFNAGTVSGKVDAGIMDGAGTRLFHGGTATNQTGANAFQTFSPLIWLLPGLYYFALSLDNTTGQIRISSGGNTLAAREGGLLQEDTVAFGIPSSFTPVAVTNPDVPYIGIYDDTTLTF